MEIKLPPVYSPRRINSISMEIPTGQLGITGGRDHQLVHNTDLVNPSDLLFLCKEIINIITFQREVNCSCTDQFCNASHRSFLNT